MKTRCAAGAVHADRRAGGFGGGDIHQSVGAIAERDPIAGGALSLQCDCALTAVHGQDAGLTQAGLCRDRPRCIGARSPEGQVAAAGAEDRAVIDQNTVAGGGWREAGRPVGSGGAAAKHDVAAAGQPAGRCAIGGVERVRCADRDVAVTAPVAVGPQHDIAIVGLEGPAAGRCDVSAGLHQNTRSRGRTRQITVDIDVAAIGGDRPGDRHRG